MADQYILGLDIGGTKIEAALFTADVTTGPISSKRIATERERGYQNVLERLSQLIIELLAENSIAWPSLKAIGVGLPGTVDPQKQVMLNGNSQIFIGKSFAKDLNQYFESPVEILCNNDASCFALAEAKLGAGLKYREQFGIPLSQQISIGIILGTGCGGGIISNGKILNGQNGGGGEIGHSTLISNGHSCYCGRKGCAEQYLCGPALERSYGEKIAARELFERAGAGEQKAIDCLQSYQKNLIEFLTNLTSIFDPHFFVLGGGLSKQALLYQSLEKGLHAQTFVPQSNPVVYQHKVSDSAGVIGAALLTLP